MIFSVHRFGTALALAVLLGLAGCGQADNGDTAGETETGAGQQTAGTTAAPQADQQQAVTETDRAEESATQQTAADTTTGKDTGASAASGAEASADKAAGDGGGESHTVTARSTSYDPMVLRIEPGDSVSWTNMSGHNVHFEKGNIPAGAEPWQTALGDNVSRTYETEGLYLYKCDPHFALGMVGALIVGTPDNVAQVEQNAQGMYKRALAKAKSAMK